MPTNNKQHRTILSYPSPENYPSFKNFVHHKSNITLSGLEPGSPLREAFYGTASFAVYDQTKAR
jgi:hypothetical protein